MDREQAVDVLIALGCCSMTGLYCYECPLWDKQKEKCRPWADDEVVEAVRLLNKEKENEIE